MLGHSFGTRSTLEGNENLERRVEVMSVRYRSKYYWVLTGCSLLRFARGRIAMTVNDAGRVSVNTMFPCKSIALSKEVLQVIDDEEESECELMRGKDFIRSHVSTQMDTAKMEMITLNLNPGLNTQNVTKLLFGGDCIALAGRYDKEVELQLATMRTESVGYVL